jgi:thioredoxin-related protein
MKILFVLLITLLTLSAEHIRWLGDYDKALQKAQNSNKPLIVYLVKKDSPKCAKILKKQFFDKEYISYINKNFIPVIVVYEGRQSYPNEMIYANSFPTLFFIDSKTEIFFASALSPKMITEENIKKAISYE